MRIKFWGVRGSTPVSGKEYLRHGGDTTCVEIRDNSKEVIIIDAGTGIRALGKKLARENLKSFTMLFTHSHWDHVIGFPFFKPVYNKNTRITVMGCSFSPDPVREIVAKTMQPPGFPVKFEEISAHFEFKSVLETGCDFEKIRMIPIETSHPNQGLGYKFEEGGRKFVFITDNELGFQHPGGKTFQDYVQFCRGADLLVHDATYTDAEYPRKKHGVIPLFSRPLNWRSKRGSENSGFATMTMIELTLK